MHVTKLTLELLANGVHPSAIAKSIAIHAKTFRKEVIIDELPSDSHMRRCRSIMQCAEEMLCGCRLAKAKR